MLRWNSEILNSPLPSAFLGIFFPLSPFPLPYPSAFQWDPIIFCLYLQSAFSRVFYTCHLYCRTSYWFLDSFQFDFLSNHATGTNACQVISSPNFNGHFPGHTSFWHLTQLISVAILCLSWCRDELVLLLPHQPLLCWILLPWLQVLSVCLQSQIFFVSAYFFPELNSINICISITWKMLC